jgi:ABC-type proline/glycine betaine transport system ATPase subunit
MKAIYQFKSVEYSAPPRESGDGPTAILKDATFDISAGDFAVITGPSGAGKTTLLRLFNRLADPLSGTIVFDGKDITEYPVVELRRRIGWVPQVPVRFPGTLEQNLKLPFTLSKEHRYTSDEIRQAIEDLKNLNLLPEHLFSRKADDLSVGEAQRLNLLRALALKPDVLLLDEPTSALDPDSADHLLRQIERIKKTRDLTAIMVSHRPEEVKRVGQLVLRMNGGKVAVEKMEEKEGDDGR